jgi:hypothetical protein
MYESHTFVLTSAGKKHFGTKKNSMCVIVVDHAVELHGGFWDGGSCTEYWGQTKSGSQTRLSYPTAPPQFGGGAAPSLMPTDDFAVVRGGVFCGKISGLVLYVNKLDGWMLPTYGTEKVRI